MNTPENGALRGKSPESAGNRALKGLIPAFIRGNE
jgi:hypothetical protein